MLDSRRVERAAVAHLFDLILSGQQKYRWRYRALGCNLGNTMLDLMRTILVGTERAGEKAIIAAPYAIPERLCHQLAPQGLLDRLPRRNNPVARTLRSPHSWLVDKSCRRPMVPPHHPMQVMILLSAVDETASAARCYGSPLENVRRIICVNAAGVVTADVDVTSRLTRLLNAIPAKVETFECAFDEMGVLLGNRLRLPPSVFDERRVLLISGSLGTGGSERQVAYTACGLSRDVGYDVYVGCSKIEPPHDLFRPDVEAAGAKIVVVETTARNGTGLKYKAFAPLWTRTKS